MQLHIGQSSLKGSFAQYAQKLDFLELVAEPQRLPKLSKLRTYREQAPEGFVFSVVLSSSVTEETEQGQQMLDYGMRVCELLEPRWVVLRSPATMRPSAASERRLGELVTTLKSRVDRSRIAWEPRGLWGGSALVRAAERFDVQPVVDARDVQPGEYIYARLMRLGVGARTGSRLMESLALNFLQAEEAILVVDGGSAMPVKREFEELIEALSLEEDDDLDGYPEEGQEEEEP